MVDIKFRNGSRTLRRSLTTIAVDALPGHVRTRDMALNGVTRRSGGTLGGRLGRFELIDIGQDDAVFSAEREMLSRSRGIGGVTPVYYMSDDEVPFVPDGTVFVHAVEGVDDGFIDQLARQHQLRLDGRTKDGAYIFTSNSQTLDPVEVAALIQNNEHVEYSQPDLLTDIEWLSLPVEDALLQRQWHLENTGEIEGSSVGLEPGADARAVAAWRLLGNLGDPQVVIGIIDDGFDLDHPDLAGKARSPWDFQRESTDVSPEFHPIESSAGNWHGTPCAGVALARSRGGDAVGVAPEASLMPVRQSSEVSAKNLISWFDHMTENGAWVVSCSWKVQSSFYELPESVHRAIERCATEGRNGKGCVVVFAAGNDGKSINDLPDRFNGFAVHPQVLAVSACTSTDNYDKRSSHGAEISVCGPSSGFPGRWITTIDVTGTYTDAFGVTRNCGEPGNYTHSFGGTSSACPLVAGVCALALGANPDLSADEVRDLIRNTARKIGPEDAYVEGHSHRFGHGCVNAEDAVKEALSRNEQLIARAPESRKLSSRA